MPWHVVADHTECGEGRFGVVKDDGGELDSCHDSREAAEAHIEMLYGREEMDGDHDGMRAKMSTASINDLPDSAFAYIEPGGKKDEQGKTVPRSLRHFPVHDAAHVRNSLGRAPQSPFGDKAMPKIRRAARKFGVAVAGKEPARTQPAGETRTLGVCTRSFDFELRGRGKGDSRTLEGYAAVYGHPAKIRDLKGDFEETIRAGAFKRSLEQRTPVMQWEHGRDPRVGAVPIAQILDLDDRDDGLYVRAELMDDPLVEPIRKAIAAQTVKGMSFRFEVTPDGDTWTRNGRTEAREVHDADVHELGPVVFPAYDATSVSVRSLLAAMAPDEIRELVHELADHLDRAVDLDTRTETIRVLDEDGLDPKQTAEDVRAGRSPWTGEPIDLTGRPTSGDAGGGDQDPAAEDGARSTSFDPRTRDRVLQARGVL